MTDLRTFAHAIPTQFSDPWALVDVWRQGFLHVDTGLLESDHAHVRNITGFSVWGNLEGVKVWFEWIEVKPQVIALRNPMGIKANARFTDAQGAPVPGELVPVFLATVVHHLEWQPSVVRWLTQQGPYLVSLRSRSRSARIASQARLLS